MLEKYKRAIKRYFGNNPAVRDFMDTVSSKYNGKLVWPPASRNKGSILYFNPTNSTSETQAKLNVTMSEINTINSGMLAPAPPLPGHSYNLTGEFPATGSTIQVQTPFMEPGEYTLKLTSLNDTIEYSTQKLTVTGVNITSFSPNSISAWTVEAINIALSSEATITNAKLTNTSDSNLVYDLIGSYPVKGTSTQFMALPMEPGEYSISMSLGSGNIVGHQNKLKVLSQFEIQSFSPTVGTGQTPHQLTVNLTQPANIAKAFFISNDADVMVVSITLNGDFPMKGPVLTLNVPTFVGTDYKLLVPKKYQLKLVTTDDVTVVSSQNYNIEDVLFTTTPTVINSGTESAISLNISTQVVITYAMIENTVTKEKFSLTGGFGILSAYHMLYTPSLPPGTYRVIIQTGPGAEIMADNDTTVDFKIVSFTPTTVSGEVENMITINLDGSVSVTSVQLLAV